MRGDSWKGEAEGGEGFEPRRERGGRGGRLVLEVTRCRRGHTAGAVGPGFLGASEAEMRTSKRGKRDGFRVGCLQELVAI